MTDIYVKIYMKTNGTGLCAGVLTRDHPRDIPGIDIPKYPLHVEQSDIVKMRERNKKTAKKDPKTYFHADVPESYVAGLFDRDSAKLTVKQLVGFFENKIASYKKPWNRTMGKFTIKAIRRCLELSY